ncbi:hypothetical protein BaRGS_00018118 [Batillaria attramentaria]|uniref:Uncharacterized protein n=1 Tax=Batillaria attramentaria TaxID=370345 RepID=A0ABD0KUM8_9CAEN
MADLAIIWIQLVLLFIRYPHKNGLCAIFVLYSMCFIPTFALSDGQYASVEVSRLEKQQAKSRLTQLAKNGAELESQTFHGSYSRVGAVKEAGGRIHLIAGECGRDDERGFARLPPDWIGVFHYKAEHSENTTSDCPHVLDRVRKALMFGASAIIILTLNPQIVKEMDISQLFSQPVVVVDDSSNITTLLSLVLRYCSQPNVPMLTMWSACGRSAGKSYGYYDGVVCLGQGSMQKDGKVDPGVFWNCYYLIVFLLMLSFVYKARMRNGEWGPADQELEASLRRLAYRALAMMQTHKYRNLMDRGQDTCAICLDQFFAKQVTALLV